MHAGSWYVLGASARRARPSARRAGQGEAGLGTHIVTRVGMGMPMGVGREHGHIHVQARRQRPVDTGVGVIDLRSARFAARRRH